MRSSSRSVSGGAASQRLLRRYEARTAAGVGSDRRAVAQTKLIVEDDVRSSGFCHASSRPESLIFRVVRHEISLDPLDRDDPIGALLYDVNIAVSHARGIPADNAVKTPRPSYRGRRSGILRRLIDFCRARLTHFKCPTSVDFVDSLPKSGTGKIQKRLVRDRYWNGGNEPTA